MMCYYLNVHFQGQRVNYTCLNAVFCLENVRARTTNMDITSFFPKHLVLTYIHIPYGTTTPSGPDSYLYRGFTITLRYTTVGRNPLDE